MSRPVFPLCLGFLLLIARTGADSQWQTVGALASWSQKENEIILEAPPAELRVSFAGPGVARVRLSTTGHFQPDSSWAVIHRSPDQKIRVRDGEKFLSVISEELTLEINKSPLRIAFFDSAHHLLNRDDSLRGISWCGEETCNWKVMPAGEHYSGFGEKSTALDKRGIAMSMWNSDIPAYSASTDPLYEDIPFFYGVTGTYSYGIFFDNTYYASFNMGKEDPDVYSFGATGGELNYYFISGPQPADILAKYSQLTGTMPMPPEWALGYQQCRWSYYPEKRVREIASLFRTKRIPCDAIYLDIHYMDGYRCFTWDSSRFPDPGRMIGDLANEGFKTIVIIDPGIKIDSSYWVFRSGMKENAFLRYPDGRLFTGQVWPGDCHFPDFTDAKARTWWGSLFSGLTRDGIRGFWNDMNEPSVFNGPGKTINPEVIHNDRGLFTDHRKNHNIYGMQMVRATREGVLALRPGERPFVLTRANYAGGQRYSAAWTGDNSSTWTDLQMALPMCLNLSISGQPFVGTDIGGFIGMPSGELYARWLELGVFTPLMRSHAEINSPNKEPWEYGKDFEGINRRTIELRYKLLPYIYSSFREASVTGIPMMRPLVFDYPADPRTYHRGDEFLFGKGILVAPVLQPGAARRDVFLPEGGWYDYWSDSLYSGPRSVTIDAPLDRIPFFIRAGSVIPSRRAEQYTSEKPLDTLFLTVYPRHDTAEGANYEDDGISFKYQTGEYAWRKILVTRVGSSLRCILNAQAGTYRPPSRYLCLVIKGRKAEPSSVVADGRRLRGITGLPPAGTGEWWSYDQTKNELTVTLRDEFRRQEISVTGR